MTAPVSEREPALDELCKVAWQLGSQEVARDAQALAERLAEGRFFVACVGEFKRRKSTLLNALVADEILPTGVVPVTAGGDGCPLRTAAARTHHVGSRRAGRGCPTP
jgi:dynamin family protein